MVSFPLLLLRVSHLMVSKLVDNKAMRYRELRYAGRVRYYCSLVSKGGGIVVKHVMAETDDFLSNDERG